MYAAIKSDDGWLAVVDGVVQEHLFGCEGSAKAYAAGVANVGKPLEVFPCIHMGMACGMISGLNNS